jgi:dolichol-phosphate mannosyltransferase
MNQSLSGQPELFAAPAISRIRASDRDRHQRRQRIASFSELSGPGGRDAISNKLCEFVWIAIRVSLIPRLKFKMIRSDLSSFLENPAPHRYNRRTMSSRHLLSPRVEPTLLSIVIPAYNEQAIIPALQTALNEFLATLACPVEVIFVNDGSSDQTLDLLMDWAAKDRRIKVIGLARNFGHQAAVTAGLDLAGGDAVVIIDADLQDPPHVIHEMLARYREGYDVVYGQRISREGESAIKRFTAWLFYRLMRVFIYRDLPPDAGDFRLISRRCLDAIKSMRETHRFIRGMVAWVGFAQTSVKYQRRPRTGGETKYPFWKMVRFAWTAAISFSPAPLRLSLIAGVLVALAGLGEGAYAVLRALIVHDTFPGWASAITVMSVIGGAILISIGILGEYVGRIFEASKGRPIYIVSNLANFPPEQARSIRDNSAESEMPMVSGISR